MSIRDYMIENVGMKIFTSQVSGRRYILLTTSQFCSFEFGTLIYSIIFQNSIWICHFEPQRR